MGYTRYCSNCQKTVICRESPHGSRVGTSISLICPFCGSALEEITATMATREVRARYSKGVLEPLENLELREGEEIIISVKEVPMPKRTLKALKATAGAWKGTQDEM